MISQFFQSLSRGTVTVAVASAISFAALWVPVHAHSPHDHIECFHISKNYVEDSTLFVSIRSGLLRSTDGGTSWNRVVRGLDNREPFTSIAAAETKSGTTLYLGTEGDGIYKSVDGGTSWTHATRIPQSSDFRTLLATGNVVLAASRTKGLFRAEASDKEKWRQVIGKGPRIAAMALGGQHQDTGSPRIFAGDEAGTLRVSDDAGLTWKKMAAFVDSGGITAIESLPSSGEDDFLAVGTQKSGVLRSVDGGATFTPANDGLTDKNVTYLALSPEKILFASTWDAGVFRSVDLGGRWEASSEGISKDNQADDRHLPHFVDSGKGGGATTIFHVGYDGLFKSFDGGRFWTELETLSVSVFINIALSPAFADDGTILANTYWRGAFLSEDRGKSWRALSGSVAPAPWKQHQDKIHRTHGVAFSPDFAFDRTIFLGMRNNLLISDDAGDRWRQIDLSDLNGDQLLFVDRIVVSPAFSSDRTVFFGGRIGYDKTRGWGVFRSTDGGETFTLMKSGEGRHLQSLAISPNFASDGTIFTGSAERGGGSVWRSDDRGENWVETAEGLVVQEDGPDLALSPAYADDKTLLAGTIAGLFKTTDAGNQWSKVATPELEGRSYIEAVAISPEFPKDQTLIIMVKGRGLFKSQDGGVTFHQTGEHLIEANTPLSRMWSYLPGEAIRFSPDFENDQSIFGSSGLELFRSTNAGDKWQPLGLRKFSRERIGRSDAYYIAPTVGWIAIGLLALWFVARRLVAAKRTRTG
jgi:photosystem II stability/assembly factor-like uncharacterized protein